MLVLQLGGWIETLEEAKTHQKWNTDKAARHVGTFSKRGSYICPSGRDVGVTSVLVNYGSYILFSLKYPSFSISSELGKLNV